MEHPFTSPDALANDPSFRAYVRETDPEAAQKWSAWLARHPDRAADVEVAAQLVRQLDAYVPRQLTPSQLDAEIRRLQHRLHTELPHSEANPPVRGLTGWRTHPMRWLAAASVVGLLLAGGFRAATYLADRQSLANSPENGSNVLSRSGTLPVGEGAVQPLAAQTTYGQRRTVRLPDSSVVTLNARSTLTLSPDWANGVREVTLNGEAYFRVSKQQRDGQAVKFVVRAGGVAVEVLGTQFNVSTRRRRVKVVLNEGHVRLNVPGSARTFEMLPGDLVEVTEKQAVTLSSRIETAEHVAWVTDELIFDDTPLSSVAETIRDNYGYTVEFADPALANKRLTATLPDANLDVLLRALEKAFALSITKTDNTIRLAKAR